MKHLFFALFSLIFLVGCGKKESSISRDEIIEAETRKALRHKFDLDPKSKGAIINSLVLQKKGENKYVGSVEITDLDGSITKLDLEVTDHGGKVFFETKLPQKIVSEKTATVLWEFETEGMVWSSPAVGADGTVYVGSWDRKVYALDGKTGAKIWEFETGRYVSSSPTVSADGIVYIGSDDNKVYALDGKTGTKKWEFKTGYYVLS